MRQPHGDESRCEHGVILGPLDHAVALHGGQVKSMFCQECWASVRCDEAADPAAGDIAEALNPEGTEMIEKRLRAPFERRRASTDSGTAD